MKKGGKCYITNVKIMEKLQSLMAFFDVQAH